MLELLSEDIRCHVAAADGWSPSLIASMAMVSRHMTSMAHCHIWPAYCRWRSIYITRELTEDGETSGGKREKEGDICRKHFLKESHTEGKMEDERRNKEGGKGGKEIEREKDGEIEMAEERGKEREGEGEWESRDPPGGWIALVRLLTFCRHLSWMTSARSVFFLGSV